MAVATTEFTAQKTEIPGLIIFDITSIADDRGWFQEKYHHQKLVNAGLLKNFQVVQNNISFNKDPGVTRGFHAEPWDKYISVVTGKVFCAYVDVRQGKNFGKLVTVELDRSKAVFLPQGVANAFQTIEPNTYYIYSVNDHWQAKNYDKYAFFNLSDPEAGVKWPIALENSIMSDRDKNHPPLSQLKPSVDI